MFAIYGSNAIADEKQENFRGGDTSYMAESKRKDKKACTISLHLAEEAKEEIPSPLTILHEYRGHVKRFRRGKIIRPVSGATATTPCGQELSAQTIVRIAKVRLLQQTCQDFGDSDSIFPHSDLSCENLKEVELIYSLLEAAEKLSNGEFECAEKLLEKCFLIISCSDGNPVVRAVKMFGEALGERADSERGKIDLERTTFDLEESLLNYQPVILACEGKLPSSQLTQFTAIQAILDSIGSSAKIIHLVDFGVKTGLHWSIMIQGLASRGLGPPQLLKITALGSSKERLEETGRRLSSFAESMQLPFLFRSVVAEIKDVDLQLFEAEADEAVVVYSGLRLWSQLACPNSLASFIHFVKKLNPCVMVVNEVEANTNASVYTDRLYGALPFIIAMFDCLDTCLKGEATYRKIVEEVFIRDMIRSISAAEEVERTYRHAKISVLRELFAEFNIVETELSPSSLDQARFMISTNTNWSPCTLHMDGKCMIVNWRGTPLQSISVWKIHTL